MPGTGTLATDTFRLAVVDSKNQGYILLPATISDEQDLIALLLRRIANAKAQIGWKFDAVFYQQQQAGVITG